MDSNATVNFAEYRVEKKNEGTHRLKRVGIFIGWSLVPLITMVIGLAFFKPLLWLTPVVVMMVLYTGRYTLNLMNIDYEYCVVSGEFRVDAIHGNAIRKSLAAVRLSDMNAIAPYRDEYKAAADDPAIQKRIEAVSTMSSPDIYYGLYTDEDGLSTVVFFEATAKILKLAKLFNPSTVVTEVTF